MTMPNTSEDTAQNEGEATESSDISKKLSSVTITPINGFKSTLPTSGHNVPLPPPEANAYDKHPGHTRGTLEKLVTALKHPDGGIPFPPPSAIAPPSKSATQQKDVTKSTQATSSNGSSVSSPTVSESEWGSAPSTRPPSQAPSRAPSMSAGTSGGKLTISTGGSANATTDTTIVGRSRAPSEASLPSSPTTNRGHKFNLKDLLASGPKLARKSSARSTSSKRSDSEGGKKPKSTAGDSTVSLTKKYGACQKVAIGKGATSVVRLAHKWDRTEEKLYAVKEFRKRRKNESEKEYVKKLTAEFCISSTLHHPNIVETVDLVQDENQHWCEVMEFCPGGDLYAAIKKGGMSPSEVECCFRQILEGVGYLHSQGVAHRDIKPENLFFDTKGHLKIGDYGASTVYRLPWEATIHMSSGLCGSEPYIAPEQFMGKPYDARLVDIWACGIVYYCLHFQELPWRSAQPASDTMYASYATACASSSQATSACPPTINNLSPRSCRSIIRRMLEPDPKNRASIEEVLAHAWVKSIEVCYTVEEPKHVHVHARAMGLVHVKDY